jgi:hypothetical protein
MTDKKPNSVDELCAAALAVTQAARPTPARGVMTVPDWQIRRLRTALEKVDAEFCALEDDGDEQAEGDDFTEEES